MRGEYRWWGGATVEGRKSQNLIRSNNPKLQTANFVCK